MSGAAYERALKAHFAPDELLWRVQSSGRTQDGKPWARVLCYVDARAVQERLDLVFGWDGWQTDYTVTADGILCHLKTRGADGGWITKTDGSPETQVEAFKGGISKALVRVAASGYGIGRYLYGLTESFATCSPDRPSRADMHAYHCDKIGNARVYWLPPALPQWALPDAEDAAVLATFADANGRFGQEAQA